MNSIRNEFKLFGARVDRYNEIVACVTSPEESELDIEIHGVEKKFRQIQTIKCCLTNIGNLY